MMEWKPTSSESKASSPERAKPVSGPPVLMFNASKRESHHPNSGFKKLYRRLKGSYKVQLNKDDISLERLREASVAVFGCPREKFSSSEFGAIKDYIEEGGSVLIALGEGGEGRCGTNVNYLLEEFGIAVNSDSVVRTVFYKYLHPKEVFIANGVINKAIVEAAHSVGRKDLRGKPSTSNEASDRKASEEPLEFVYPRGSTLSVQEPATPILSSGYIAYPLNRPIGAVYSSKKSGGRLCVLGSVEMFADEWISKEQNAKLQDVLFRWLSKSEEIKLDSVDPEETDISEYVYLPDTHSLAEQLRSCLQESEPIPSDFTKLFDDALFKFDTNLIPEAVALYEQLNVKHEPLSLIPPQFQCPLPPLAPAVFPPTMREPPPPALDQFDLDEHFASERLRLAQLTNKCTDDDLEYYIRDSGEILGVTSQLMPNRRSAKEVLEYIFRQVVNFKKLNPDQPKSDGFGPSGAIDLDTRQVPRATGISDVYTNDLSMPVAGPAGIGPGVAAGFNSSV